MSFYYLVQKQKTKSKNLKIKNPAIKISREEYQEKVQNITYRESFVGFGLNSGFEIRDLGLGFVPIRTCFTFRQGLSVVNFGPRYNICPLSVFWNLINWFGLGLVGHLVKACFSRLGSKGDFEKYNLKSSIEFFSVLDKK